MTKYCEKELLRNPGTWEAVRVKQEMQICEYSNILCFLKIDHT